MVVSDHDGNNFYKVTDLCKVTKKYIIHKIPVDKRYLYGISNWYVHSSELPYLLKRAKETGIHTLDYSSLPSHIIDTIEIVLGKNRVVLKPIKSNDYYSQLHLTNDVPTFIVEACWKAILRNCHPDVGGDPEVFLKYKEAYERVKKK